MGAAALARLVTRTRARLARGSPSADVFSPCPLFLLVVIAVLAVAEVGAALFGLPAPHQTIPPRATLVAGLFVSAIFASIALPRTPLDWFRCAAAGLILPLGNVIMPAALAETVVFLPNIYDRNVVPLDGAFGGQVSFALGALFAQHSGLSWVCAIIYAGVLLPPALLAIAEAHTGRRAGIGSLPTFLAIAGVGFIIYHILPVIGPMAYFGDEFPLRSVRAHMAAPRNCMPSLHTAWVLMAFLCARRMPITRTINGIWLAIMLVATLGFGEHYLTDLICAVPFVLGLRALCATDVAWSARARSGGLLVAVLLFSIWGLAVRGAIHPADVPGLVPAFTICTIAVSLVWERRLARAQGLLPSATVVRRPHVA